MRKVEIDAELLVGDDRLEDVVVVDEVLARLTELDPQQGRIVELRFLPALTCRKRRKYWVFPLHRETRMEDGEGVAAARDGRGATVPMTAERWAAVKEIFHCAVECDPAARTALVRERCGNDSELFSEVLSLLNSDDQTGSRLDCPLKAFYAKDNDVQDQGAFSPQRCSNATKSSVNWAGAEWALSTRLLIVKPARCWPSKS